ncbi:MAG: hypothetical protein PHF24_06795 [Syntrophomonas sp.]|nr:hypothetical protein [Syntrophomonas sp.]
MNLLDYYFYNNNAYAKQMEDYRYLTVRQAVTPDLIEDHLAGRITLACYPLLGNKCRLGCIDIDYYREFEFTEQEETLARNVSRQMVSVLDNMGIRQEQIYGEWSGRRGIHLWLFFREPVLAAVVRQILNHAVKQIDLPSDFIIEIYPKQDDANNGLGNAIKVPFGVHRRTGNRTFLEDIQGNHLDPENLHLITIDCGQLNRIARRIHIAAPAHNTPVLTGSVDLLMQRCQLLVNYYNNPHGINYNTWLGIGTNLYPLGEEGIECWRNLSQRDAIGWDEDIFNAKLKELDPLKPYSCTKIGCTNNCRVGNPIRHLQQPYLITKKQTQATEYTVPLEVVRQIHHDGIASILSDYTPTVYLDNGFPGLGKTQDVATQIFESKYSATWIAPNHNQAQQVMNIWTREAVHLKSRKQMVLDHELECPHLDHIEQAYLKGLPARYMYCNETCCHNVFMAK